MFNFKNIILAAGVLVALLGIVNANLAIFGFGVLIGIIALFIIKTEEKLDAESPAVPTPEPVKVPEPVKAPEPAPVVVKAPEPVVPPVELTHVKQEVKKAAPAIKAPPAAAPKKRGRKPTKK
jgi:hypothetical protein